MSLSKVHHVTRRPSAFGIAPLPRTLRGSSAAEEVQLGQPRRYSRPPGAGRSAFSPASRVAASPRWAAAVLACHLVRLQVVSTVPLGEAPSDCQSIGSSLFSACGFPPSLQEVQDDGALGVQRQHQVSLHSLAKLLSDDVTCFFSSFAAAAAPDPKLPECGLHGLTPRNAPRNAGQPQKCDSGQCLGFAPIQAMLQCRSEQLADH
eukprot:CAMPEP_0183522996 /NCGR_PEP_ID=MMETSP0371-20130417/18844_1 /TAXON_ID=268820 /ORGANISM="Peridinium aciculiferum, Strain PAER-2" /LENGTH=204 /DNA_ID=CAMNT_0025721857 /DNA_START=383 /DNA_END=998 /DNA_ORIENTATION=-